MIEVKCAYDEMVPIGDVKPNPRNPNTHPKRQIELLARIIQYQGWRAPITVSRLSGLITRGHGRLQAAQLSECREIPVDYQDYDDEAQEWADVIADNKIAELAEFDDSILQTLLAELDNAEFDTRFTGFEDAEIEKLMKDVRLKSGLTDPDAIPEVDPKAPATTRPGDLWILGSHRLLCGDAENREAYEQLMGDERAAMFFADPPYNVNYVGGTMEKLTIKNDNLKNDRFYSLLYNAFKNAWEYTIAGGGFYVFHSDGEWRNFRSAIEDARWLLKGCLIWVKNQFVIGRGDYHFRHEPILYGWKPGAAHRWHGGRDKQSVYEDTMPIVIDRHQDGSATITFAARDQIVIINVPAFEVAFEGGDELTSVWWENKPLRNEDHPTIKPVALIERGIINSSRRGEAVLDNFGGAGTSIIACERTNRRCRMLEIDEYYCDITVRRWEEYTGEKAIRLNDRTN